MKAKGLVLAAVVAAMVGSLSLCASRAEAMPIDRMREGCANSGGVWWWIDMNYSSCIWSVGNGDYMRSIVDRRGREVATCAGSGDVEICDDF